VVYRGGLAIGFITAGAALAGVQGLLWVGEGELVAVGYALGASVTGLVTRVGGGVYMKAA